MKVLRILTDVRLVIAELEVNLGEEVRNCVGSGKRCYFNLRSLRESLRL